MNPSSLLVLSLTLPWLHGPAQDGPDEPPPPNPRIMSVAEGGQPRGLVAHEERALDGVTLLSPLSSHRTVMIDMRGEVLHEWRHGSTTSTGLYLLEDGSLLRGGRQDEGGNFNGGGIGGFIQRVAPDGSVLWRYDLATESEWLHHDIEPLPNGNVLAILWERMSAEEAVALGRDPDHVGKAGFWTDSVIEIEPTPPTGGKVVWRWRSRDHLVQDFDERAAGYGSVVEHPGRLDINFDHRDKPPMTAEQIEAQKEIERQMRALGYAGGDEPEDEDEDGPSSRYDRSGDWLHTNAVSYQPEYDLIVLSSPHLSEVLVIDHSTTTEQAASSSGGRFGRGGEILWRWGNPANYGLGDDDDRALYYQHDPTWLDYGGGELGLLLFNNGSERGDPPYSSVEELVLPFDPERGFSRDDGEPFGPEEPDWLYAPGNEAFFSAFISGAQRLPNGNTLVCSGVPGRLFELTPSREVVWDFKNPWGGEIEPPDHAPKTPPYSLFRALRLPRDHPGVAALLD